MKKRLTCLAAWFVYVMLAFALQKVVFMLCNGSMAKGTPLADYGRVITHGFTLDAATTGYVIALPWLVILISVWFVRFPLRKVLVGYYALISLALALIFVADIALYPFWGFKLDASVFQYLDSLENALASVSIGFIGIRLLCILLLAALLAAGMYALTPQRLQRVSHRLIGTAGLLLLGGGLFIIIRGGVTESTSNVGQAYFCNNEFLNHSAVNPAFSLLSSISKSKDYAAQFDFFPEAERAQLFDELYPTGDEGTEELLNTRRPNILIILMEGFGGVFMEPLGGLPDVSPNLNRIAREGVFFTQCYANSFRTDRGTICAFSGYQSFPDLSVMKMPVKSRTLSSIASELVKAGYATDFLYGGDINFTNMKSYLLESGYQKLTSDTDFPVSERKNPWGVNDDVTCNYLYNQVKQRTSGPWHMGFLTLSSHEPFEVPYHRLEDRIPNAFAFTDHCIGRLIDLLKELPQWKNLLIICLPDHGFYYPPEGLVHDPRIHHIPMIWTGGAVKRPAVINKLMNQSDLAATLLGQLGISHRTFPFSRNVLSRSYRYPFAYYTYNNGFAFCDSTGVTLMDNNSDQVLLDIPSPDANRLKRGKAILQSSYDDLGKR